MHVSAVWAAVGQAPNGQVTSAGAFGQELRAGGGTASFGVDDRALVSFGCFNRKKHVAQSTVGCPCVGPYRL
jgi:hypothetical protein